MTLGQTITSSLLCYSRFSTFWQRSLSLSQWLWPPTCWQTKVKCNSVNAMFPRLIYADICSSFGCFFLCGSGQSTRSPPQPQNGSRYHDRTLNGVTSLFQRCSGPAKESTGACMHPGRKANLSMNPVQMPNQTRLPSTHNNTQAEQLYRDCDPRWSIWHTPY